MRLDLGIAELGEGRHLRQEGRALRPANGKCLDATGFELRHRGGDAGEGELHFAGHDRWHGERDALVRHVHKIDARLVFQHLAREVRLAAAAVGGIVDRAGLRLRERDQLLERIRRQRRIRHQELLQQHKHRQRDEVALRVVRQLGVKMRVDGERRVGGEEHRGAVGRALRHRLGREDRVRARLVLDDDGLSPYTGELLRELARHDVDAAARRIGDDDAHRLAGPALRVRAERKAGKKEGEAQSHLGSSAFYAARDALPVGHARAFRVAGRCSRAPACARSSARSVPGRRQGADARQGDGRAPFRRT